MALETVLVACLLIITLAEFNFHGVQAQTTAKPATLCDNMRAYCDEAANEIESELLLNKTADYTSVQCQVMLTVVGCVENYLCTCQVSVGQKVRQDFTNVIMEYFDFCKNATGHDPRSNTSINCLVNEPLPGVTASPSTDLMIGDVLEQAQLKVLERRLLEDCPNYGLCALIYNTASARASQLEPAKSFNALCQANRYNVICMSDSLCGCGEAENPLINKTLTTIANTHQEICKTEIAVPLLNCDPVDFCANLQVSCSRFEAVAHYSSVEHPDADYGHCHVLVTSIDCMEKYLCTCNITLTPEFISIFQDSFYQYYYYCWNVTGHRTRNQENPYCYQPPALTDNDGDPSQGTVDQQRGLELGDELKRNQLEELGRRLLADCPAYKHCSDTYFSAYATVLSLPSTQQVGALCQAHRYNLVCMSDAFCDCGEAEEELIKNVMNDLTVLHETYCHEQIKVPILACSGFIPTISRTLFVGTWLFLQLFWNA